MDVFRTPDQRFADLEGFDFEPHYVEMDGLRMHHLDEGSGHPILLLHGEPTWSYLYRRMVPILREHGRVVAPDYFGFGRSDKPTDRSFYTYDRHSWSIAELVRRLDLRDVTLVVQDWGGPIGLRVAMEDAARFARLVIMNTALFVPSHRPPGEGFMNWRHFAERVGLDMPIGFVVQSGCITKLPEPILAGYEAPFPEREAKTGAAVFPLIVPLRYGDPGVREMLWTRDGLSNWHKPALVLFGDSDPIFSPGTARRMAQLIPGAGEPEIVDYASHFIQEDKGEEVAERIARFVRET
jgi:haloalkane dehalogenase